MRWDEFRTSENVEDRRGMGGGFPGGGGGLGLGGVVVLGLLGWALGIDPRLLIGGAEVLEGARQQHAPVREGRRGAPTDDIGGFVAKVLGENEDVWSRILPEQAQKHYEKPVLVLFSGATQSGCGFAQSATGPFYCPLDRKVYLDTSFFNAMKRRFGGGGDFAYSYVIAHEIGHHVQNLIGVLPRVQQAQKRAASQSEANALSVRNELMADCLAGVWSNAMNQARHNIDENDVRQALATASAIGDDRLQQQAQGRVVPDSFTHGTAEQRTRWFMTGFTQGRIGACNTFRAAQL
jgi:predicted metalloprotease